MGTFDGAPVLDADVPIGYLPSAAAVCCPIAFFTGEPTSALSQLSYTMEVQD